MERAACQDEYHLTHYAEIKSKTSRLTEGLQAVAFVCVCPSLDARLALLDLSPVFLSLGGGLILDEFPKVLSPDAQLRNVPV